MSNDKTDLVDFGDLRAGDLVEVHGDYPDWTVRRGFAQKHGGTMRVVEANRSYLTWSAESSGIKDGKVQFRVLDRVEAPLPTGFGAMVLVKNPEWENACKAVLVPGQGWWVENRGWWSTKAVREHYVKTLSEGVEEDA